MLNFPSRGLPVPSPFQPLEAGCRLHSPVAVRAILDALRIRPSKAMGQNFLVDANILRLLLDAAAIQSEDRVLEVGPGLGIVTNAILERGASVTAVEKDHRLADWLRRYLGARPGFTLVEADMLTVTSEALPGAPFNAVISNLPYRDGSRILVSLARAPNRPARMALTVQKEVARRLTAAPGTRDYGLLTLWVALHYTVEARHNVSPRCFFPTPTVDSTIIRLTARPEVYDAGTEARYHALTKAAFRHRRKQLTGIVRASEAAWPVSEDACRAWLVSRGLPASARPEDLSPELWRALTDL